MLGLFFLLPFSIGLFSCCKIFLNIRQHQVNVVPSLQNSRDQAGVRISVQEINMSCTLACVAGGFLLVPAWAFTLWKRFSPETAPRIVHLTIQFLLYLSSTINPFIYAARNRVSEKNPGNCYVGGKSDVHQLKLILMQMQNEVVVRK